MHLIVLRIRALNHIVTLLEQHLVSSHFAPVSRSSQSLCFARAGGNRALLAHVRELGLQQLSKTHTTSQQITEKSVLFEKERNKPKSKNEVTVTVVTGVCDRPVHETLFRGWRMEQGDGNITCSM